MPLLGLSVLLLLGALLVEDAVVWACRPRMLQWS
jgi:hypothetical protein